MRFRMAAKEKNRNPPYAWLVGHGLWPEAPLIALAAALLRLHPRLAISTARGWHGMLASPNSGWSEAACAGALRVRLIGPISYRGRVVNEAFMGEEAWPVDLDGRHLEQALRLILVCGVLALVTGLGLAVWVQVGWGLVQNVWLG